MTEQPAPLPHQPMGARAATSLGSVPARVAIATVVVLWTLPVAGALITSLQPTTAADTRGWWSLLTEPSLSIGSYRAVLADGPGGAGLFGHLLNTLAIAVPAVLAIVVIGSLAAYAFAWMQFRGRDWLFVALVASALVPLQAVLIPLVDSYHDGFQILGLSVVPGLELAGTRLGLWLAHAAFGVPIAVFLLRGHFATIPRDLVEAARTDGAGHLATLGRVVLPLSIPALVALAAFHFLWIWNDYLVAVTLGGGVDSGVAPVTVGLADLVATRGNELGLLASGAIVTLAVPAVLYAILQHRLDRAIAASALTD